MIFLNVFQMEIWPLFIQFYIVFYVQFIYFDEYECFLQQLSYHIFLKFLWTIVKKNFNSVDFELH